jgi:hypothetical protein
VLAYQTTRRHTSEYSNIHIRSLKTAYLAIAQPHRVAYYFLKIKKSLKNQKILRPHFVET